MQILIGLLTVVLVLNSAFLILLILIQLPKKEAGAGAAFGGGAMQDMFGAQHGNVLTTATKYSASLFLVLALGLSWMNKGAKDGAIKGIEEQLKEEGKAPVKVEETPKTDAADAAAAVSNVVVEATSEAAKMAEETAGDAAEATKEAASKTADQTTSTLETVITAVSNAATSTVEGAANEANDAVKKAADALKKEIAPEAPKQ
jgi:preprotein translocase subunit SecG